MTDIAAFLRGINVGGNKKVPMKDLTKVLEKTGLTNVKTLLASGNVVFSAKTGDLAALQTTIEAALKKAFGFEISVLLRTVDDLRRLAENEPFKGIRVTPATRLYVTFITGKPKGAIPIPYATDDGNFRILRATKTEVLSVLTVTPDRGSVDAMAVIEKEFGKTVTTRNWNTIEKVLKVRPDPSGSR